MTETLAGFVVEVAKIAGPAIFKWGKRQLAERQRRLEDIVARRHFWPIFEIIRKQHGDEYAGKWAHDFWIGHGKR